MTEPMTSDSPADEARAALAVAVTNADPWGARENLQYAAVNASLAIERRLGEMLDALSDVIDAIDRTGRPDLRFETHVAAPPADMTPQQMLDRLGELGVPTGPLAEVDAREEVQAHPDTDLARAHLAARLRRPPVGMPEDEPRPVLLDDDGEPMPEITVEHDETMPHNVRKWQDGDVTGCPPNCPARIAANLPEDEEYRIDRARQAKFAEVQQALQAFPDGPRACPACGSRDEKHDGRAHEEYERREEQATARITDKRSGKTTLIVPPGISTTLPSGGVLPLDEPISYRPEPGEEILTGEQVRALAAGAAPAPEPGA